MNRIGRFALYLAAVAVVCSALGLGLLSTARGSEGTRDASRIDTERSFSMNDVTALDIRTVSADVRFHEVTGSEVRIHLRGSYSGLPESRPELQASSEGGTVRAVVRHPRRFVVFNWSWHSELTLDVYLPKKALDLVRVHTTSGNCTAGFLETKRFEFNSVSGNLTATELKTGSTDVRATSGDVRLDRLSGDLNYSSVSGDLVTAESITGNSTLQTTSGDVRLAGLKGGLSHRSVSGDLRAEFVGLESDIRLNTTSGHLELTLPADAQFGFDFRTTSGGFTCDFPVLSGESGSRTRMTGTVGNGKNRIEARSVSGNLQILRG